MKAGALAPKLGEGKSAKLCKRLWLMKNSFLAEFAKIKLRRDASEAIFSNSETIFHHPNFGDL